MTFRCGRDYENTIQFEQTPDVTSKELPNGERELFSLHMRCRFCGVAHFEQKLTAQECQRRINKYRSTHSTCHARELLKQQRRG